jgi:hypothetical protein
MPGYGTWFLNKENITKKNKSDRPIWEVHYTEQVNNNTENLTTVINKIN